MLMKAGDELTQRYNFDTLRNLYSVGEPLNPEAVVWGEKIFGKAFHDNWWQTETGSIMIANYPIQDIKPGSMGRPMPGITAEIVDDEFNVLPFDQEGNLALRPGWPSMFRTYWKKEEMYESRFQNGWYITGDRAKKDEEGYFWFVGRTDDVINTAGHLVGPRIATVGGAQDRAAQPHHQARLGVQEVHGGWTELGGHPAGRRPLVQTQPSVGNFAAHETQQVVLVIAAKEGALDLVAQFEQLVDHALGIGPAVDVVPDEHEMIVRADVQPAQKRLQ